MDFDRIDQQLRNRVEQETLELPNRIEKTIDSTLEELPDQRLSKPQRFSKGMTYWLSGVACALFAVLLFTYFQNENPQSGTVSSENTFIHEPFPYEKAIDWLTLKTDSYSFPEEYFDEVKIWTSIHYEDRWFAIIEFGEKDIPFVKLVEFIDKGDQYTVSFAAKSDFTISDNEEYSHWYDEENGIGFGAVNPYGDHNIVDSVKIYTKGKEIISHVHGDGYIYMSPDKPEKVEFLSEDQEVLRTMETFNFDPVYPFIARDAGEYSLLIVDQTEETGVLTGRLHELGIDIKTIQRRGMTAEQANEEHPFLQLEKTPALILFVDTEMVLKTYDEEELIQFLSRNPNNKVKR